MNQVTYGDIVDAMHEIRSRGYDPDTLFVGGNPRDVISIDKLADETDGESRECDTHLGDVCGIDVKETMWLENGDALLADSHKMQYYSDAAVML